MKDFLFFSDYYKVKEDILPAQKIKSIVEMTIVFAPFIGYFTQNYLLYSIVIYGYILFIFFDINLEQSIMNNVFFLLNNVNKYCCKK